MKLAKMVGVAAVAFGSWALMAGRSGAVRAADAPQHSDALGYVAHDFQREILAAYRKQLGDAYQSGGRHDPKWDAAAEAALDLMARFDAENTTHEVASPGFTSTPEISDEQMEAAAQKAIDLGCADPMLLYARGLSLINRGLTQEGRPWIDKANAAFEGSPYGASQHFRVLMRRWMLAGDPRGEAEVWKVMEPVCEQMAAGPFLNGAVRREAAARFGEALNLQRIEQRQPTLDRMAGFSGIDPWIVNVARTGIEIGSTWQSRGTGWASEITPEGQRGVAEHSAKARAAAGAAYREHPELPEPAVSMIELAMLSGSTDDEREWFARATKAQADYAPAYSALYQALEPRWGGSQEELLAMGKRAADSGRFDTSIPWEYILAAREIADDDRGGDKQVFTRPDVKKTVSEVLAGYVGRWKGTPQAAFFESAQAAFAIQSKDYPGAKGILDQIVGPVDTEAFYAMGINPTKSVEDVYMRTFSDRQAVGRYDQAVNRGNYANAQKFLDNLTAKEHPTGRALETVQNAQAGVKLMSAYEGGERISLNDEAGRSFWYAAIPYAVDGGAIVTLGKGGLSLSNRFYLDDRHYQLHMAFEFLDSNATAGTGLSLGWGMGDNRVGWSLMLMADSALVTVQAPKSADQDTDRDIPFPPLSEQNTIDIVYFDGTPTLKINGKDVSLNFAAPEAVRALPAKNTLALTSNAAIRITEMTLQHTGDQAPSSPATPAAKPSGRRGGRGRSAQTQSDLP